MIDLQRKIAERYLKKQYKNALYWLRWSIAQGTYNLLEDEKEVRNVGQAYALVKSKNFTKHCFNSRCIGYNDASTGEAVFKSVYELSIDEINKEISAVTHERFNSTMERILQTQAAERDYVFQCMKDIARFLLSNGDSTTKEIEAAMKQSHKPVIDALIWMQVARFIAVDKDDHHALTSEGYAFAGNDSMTADDLERLTKGVKMPEFPQET